MTSHAAWSLHDGRSDRVVLTCEHASANLPSPWSWHPDDDWIRTTHWASDLGAAKLTTELAGTLDAAAVMARYTRLLVDPNRAEHDPTLVRTEADGRPVRLNTTVPQEELERRLNGLHRPYHAAVRSMVDAHAGAMVLAVHSFTPTYDGRARSMEVGVLFDRDQAPAEVLASALAGEGFSVALNEPYSGRNGLMFSAQHHAERAGRAAIEIEVRQDRIVDGPWRARLVGAIARGIARI
jgi:predicted N-formylglutamate amidohydrolase